MLARSDLTFSLTLPSDREIAMRRVFNAPRGRVFDAWTKPEQVRRWYGCGALTLIVCEIDLRVGGSYCYVLRGPDGVNHGLEGTYREIVAPERLVYTERYVTQNFESNEALVTVTFTERHGKTTLDELVCLPSARGPRRAPGIGRGSRGGADARAACRASRHDGVSDHQIHSRGTTMAKTKVQPTNPYLTIKGAAKAIDFYKKAFLAKENVRMPAPDGKRLMHADLSINGGTVMLSRRVRRAWRTRRADPEQARAGGHRHPVRQAGGGRRHLSPRGGGRLQGHPGAERHLLGGALRHADRSLRPQLDAECAAAEEEGAGEEEVAAERAQQQDEEDMAKQAASVATPGAAGAPAAQQFVITRTYDAPRDLVWKAWTEADRLAQWWGPRGAKIRVIKLEVRPGGVFHYSMQFKPGHEMFGRFVYREIAAPERLVFINSFSDADGGLTRAPFPQLGDKWPLEVLNTLTLAEQGGKTTLTLRGNPINATEEEVAMYTSMFDSMRQGFGGSFDKLAEHLAKASQN